MADEQKPNGPKLQDLCKHSYQKPILNQYGDIIGYTCPECGKEFKPLPER